MSRVSWLDSSEQHCGAERWNTVRLTGKQICLVNHRGQMVSALSYIHAQYVIHREAWFQYAENNDPCGVRKHAASCHRSNSAASILELRTLRVIIFWWTALRWQILIAPQPVILSSGSWICSFPEFQLEVEWSWRILATRVCCNQAATLSCDGSLSWSKA